ncbi:MAG TPA: hypothetical protein VIM42_08385 [Clostridium sp.]
MRIVNNVEKKVVVDEITAMACNKCGEYYDIDKSHSLQSIRLEFSYGSKYDGEGLQFDLCENCLMEFVNKFEIAPEKTGNEDEYDWPTEEQENVEPVEEPRPNTLEPFRYV